MSASFNPFTQQPPLTGSSTQLNDYSYKSNFITPEEVLDFDFTMASIAVINPHNRNKAFHDGDDDLYSLPNSSGGNISSGNNNNNNFNIQNANGLLQTQPASRFNSVGSQQQPYSTQSNYTQYQQAPPTLFSHLADSYPSNVPSYSHEYVEGAAQQGVTPQQLVSSNWTSPFSDYANPDTQIISYNNPPMSRRLTTLESQSGIKPQKEEDYYLFNTDIQPSHLVSKEDSFIPQDDYLYVPRHKGLEFPFSGFENDNLMMSGAEDEEIEEGISSDEDDDDNYFHDDFDDMMMNGDAGSGDFIDMDKFQQPAQPPIFLGQQPLHELEQPAYTSLKDSFASQEKILSMSNTEEESHPSNSTEVTTPDEDDGCYRLFEFNPQTAAEITANNPEHECDLINPATNVPCNKKFSRPYDLIRHQETIHASKKKIFRCVICEGRLDGGAGNGRLKTFSRGDALSRHIKVKHGLVGNDAVELINTAKANVEFLRV